MNTDRLQNDDGNVANILPRNPMRRRTARRNSGGSLVEVLIVLVVILIGVFAVIQIFPIGFTSLKKSEARLRADRLARTATESMTVDSSSLPESITFSFYNGAGVRETVTTEDPDNLNTYQGTAANKLYFSDLNKYRYISNEPIRVPLATAVGGVGFGNGVGSVHFLGFGPIFMNSTVGDPANVPDLSDQASVNLYDSYLKVTSDSLTRTELDSSNGNNANTTSTNGFRNYLRNANSYIIDYGDDGGAWIMFPPSIKARTYTISYSYEKDGNPSVVDTQPPVSILIPASPVVVDNDTPGQYVWYRLVKETFPGIIRSSSETGANNDAIQSGTDVVVRNFERLRRTDNWDASDPYQYKLVSPNVSPSANANLGVIAFNPAGANFSVSVPGGTKPFTALASYAVLDWHILRDDREVPEGSGGVAKVRTTLPSIRVRGDEFVDFTATGADRTQVYPGLYPQTGIYHPGDPLPTPADSPDIQVFNLSDSTGTARLLQQGDLANPVTGDDYWINRAGRGGTYPTGTIYINTNTVRPGSKVRILYKAQGDWAVAFQKAAKEYRNEQIVTTDGPRPIPNKAEVFALDLANDRLYFHRSELNKGVTAVFEIDNAAGTNRLQSRQFTISKIDTTGNYSYVDLSDVAPEVGTNDWRIHGPIKGASLKTRVIWQDEQNGRNPWRISDLETFVTRQAQ